MALIRINIADSLVSESAAKKPAYRVYKFGGATTLLVNSAKKAELQTVVGHLKKAKTAAVAGITASIKSNTASTKARQLPRGDKRTKLMATRKTEKAKATAEIKTAKAALREANKVAKAHGLGGLNLPLSAADIKTGVGADKALKAIRATKLTEFGVTGKRGTFKPKFLKEAAFDAIGQKTSTAKPGMGPRASVKKTQKAKEAPAAKKPSKPAAAGADKKLSDKVEKRSKAILRTVGAKADFSKASGTITNSEGKSLGNGAGVVVTEMRHHFADKNIPIVRKKDGFEIPGVVSITYNDKGATFKRLSK
ncbi:hypothetical protein MPK64_gp198 [Erwinia phage pEa_SNUABM_16]|uniref:Uncharacterized protein n=1 Tax=Erwinia phage pEa_SNUABM_16 TaxID=2869544 RepID=A0AAE8XQJ9_9CAUD|nr:hypothetical protein MPK64_gp198 [Erwinia phage pEa_SNUABM_16]QZE59101.1 hypothetical protein pEaSNUABM18_00198 [Erwinia phage pEa_SNUABM_18]UAW96342.1 hypothetical protein pEaSNUABM16_00198 [Erwinia phage pEa_SNUABM_16]